MIEIKIKISDNRRVFNITALNLSPVLFHHVSNWMLLYMFSLTVVSLTYLAVFLEKCVLVYRKRYYGSIWLSGDELSSQWSSYSSMGNTRSQDDGDSRLSEGSSVRKSIISGEFLTNMLSRKPCKSILVTNRTSFFSDLNDTNRKSNFSLKSVSFNQKTQVKSINRVDSSEESSSSDDYYLEDCK